MLRDYWGACTSLTYSVPRSTLRRLVYASLFLHLVFSSLPRRVRPIHRVRQPWLAASANNHPCCRPPGAFMGFYRHFDISREMCALSPIHSPCAVPYAVLADKSRLQSIESRSAFPAPYTTLRPSRPFQVILVTAEALRFVERRRGRRSATAPPPNPAPPLRSTRRRTILGVCFICPARSRCCRTDGRTALLVLMDIETTRTPTQEPGLQSLLARGARQRRSVAFLRCFADRFATVRLAL